MKDRKLVTAVFVGGSFILWAIVLWMVVSLLTGAARDDTAYRACAFRQSHTQILWCLDFSTYSRITAVVVTGLAIIAQAILALWHHFERRKIARQADETAPAVAESV